MRTGHGNSLKKQFHFKHGSNELANVGSHFESNEYFVILEDFGRDKQRNEENVMKSWTN